MMAYTRHTTGNVGLVEAVASVLSIGDAIGCTTDEIAGALEMPIDGRALQRDLEEMVDRGILHRWGVGRGALYTLAVSARVARAQAAVGVGSPAFWRPPGR